MPYITAELLLIDADIHIMEEMNIKNYAEQYKTELLNRVIPFWMNHSKDNLYGGYYTCLTQKGEVFDTDKFM